MQFPTTPLDADRAVKLPGQVNGWPVEIRQRKVDGRFKIMKWAIVCVVLFLTAPALAAKKTNKISQPPPQVQQIREAKPIESNLWNQKICPNGIEDIEVLLKINPYDSEGRCFNYTGRLVQLLNKNQALFSFMTASTPFSLVDFGKDSVPMGPFHGVVKGKGAFSYVPVSGSRNIIFSFVNIPKFKGREAWEKRKTIEKANEEEMKRLEKRLEADQKWKNKIENSNNSELVANPFIYTDPTTGLMWARNGNIAEMRMDWKDAIEWIKKLEYAGYKDWRLPTKEEFSSFIEKNTTSKSRRNRYLNDGFYNVQTGSSNYLTSSRYENRRDMCWSYCFMPAEWDTEGPVSSGYLWPVRDEGISSEQKLN